MLSGEKAVVGLGFGRFRKGWVQGSKCARSSKGCMIAQAMQHLSMACASGPGSRYRGLGGLPLKFQTATLRCLKVRNSWFSYKKINAEGVINCDDGTSVLSPVRTSMICLPGDGAFDFRLERKRRVCALFERCMGLGMKVSSAVVLAFSPSLPPSLPPSLSISLSSLSRES